ncbi:uncharacterized protein BX663DRAFT_520936 [Cokeromyces recurvatus]|uniref:uncharacterized protein n=1 Tax=Cokeromyces recurvatus TaxID=90255 RepID=UPI00221FB977|nr:uncharacterized protein BX663DRAFT_520936 [Cokeromyces recurvatus]KAI7899441.1 hypothetical protein BX663DRAFT_520936 [Cokeromyces recurvatus]
MKLKHHRYLIACILPFLLPYSVFADSKSVQQHLAEGNSYLISRQFNNALLSFDAAIHKEPDNYLTYFKRATAYLSLGRYNAAVDDFTKILDLKPDFHKALLERARIYAKEGSFDLAIQDLEKYLSTYPTHTDTEQLLQSVKEAQSSIKQAEIEKENGKFETCITLASTASRISPSYTYARLLRAQCHIARGEIEEAAGDFARAAQLNPSDPTILILLSKINFYSLSEMQGALTHIKQCLHYDPEQKQCKKLFKKMKKLEKTIQSVEKDIELKKYATAANRLIGTMNREGILKEVDSDYDELVKELKTNSLPKRLHFKCYQMACKLYGQQKDDEKIHLWCSKTLEIQDDDVDALSYRGEVLLKRKEFEAAVRDLEKANEISGGRDHRIRQLLQQAHQRLKMSKKRDYYKILDVSPDADTREIKKAYRKKAHEWHPDKYSGDLGKEEVERKMAEINQAYEVLSDADMRQQYDNGFDPYDPEQGSAGGGSGGHGPMGGFPFQFTQGGFSFQNGFPFGGGSNFPGGAEFKMHFN